MYEEEKQSKDLSSKIFKNAVFADSMLEAKLLPELHSDLVPTLSNLKSDDLSRHIPKEIRAKQKKKRCCKQESGYGGGKPFWMGRTKKKERERKGLMEWNFNGIFGFLFGVKMSVEES